MRRMAAAFWLTAVVLPVGLSAGRAAGAEPAATASPAASPVASSASGQDANPVVAVVDGRSITAAELDERIQLPLYEVDLARHTLRATRLHELLVERVIAPRAAAERLSIDEYVAKHAQAAGQDPEAFVAAVLAKDNVTILLVAPTPPQLAVDADDDPVRGSPDAPVTIIEFADFQCPHSRRLEPVLRRVLDAYPGRVRVVMRDLPRPFHRQARLAAQAADCAGEQGAYWPYHDVLFQNQDALTHPDLEQYAHRLNLDAQRFAACLDSGRFAAEVDADAAQAALLGVRTTPTFFVNGRYLKGAQSYADFTPLIDAELERLAGPLPAGTHAAPSPAAATPAVTGQPTAARAIDSTLTVRRAELNRLLASRAALEQQLGRGDLEVEGKRLLVVSTVASGDLYERLGLRPGDVLMQVDGEWVDSEHNPLWDALRDRQRVALTIVRRGIPQTFEYRIE